jgi:Arc/MetJ-type ribon-helix-helix transcriptional regulator
MELTLDRELENLVAEVVRSGRFESPEAFLSVAIRQYLIAREHGEAAAQKLATLREELLAADERITRGEGAEYDTETLVELFRETEADATSDSPGKVVKAAIGGASQRLAGR